MKSIIQFVSLVFFCVSAQAQQTLSLRELAAQGQELATDQALDSQRCATELKSYYQSLAQVNPTTIDTQEAQAGLKEITLSLFNTRLELRNRLKAIVASEGLETAQVQQCALAVRDVFRLHRYLEDYLGELFAGSKRYNEKTDPKIVLPLTDEAPHSMLAPQVKSWSFRSGDILISRGNAFTSAAIARIGQVDAQFSHLALLYVQGEDSSREFTFEEAYSNPNLLVLEAHIEVGSTIRTFQQYVNDGNARAALFRYPDSNLSHQAALTAYQKISNYVAASREQHPQWDAKDPNHNIPYDFQMNLQDENSLFCSEIAYFGYKQVGVKLPLFATKAGKGNNFIARLGVTNTDLFAPGDMELDTRFDYIGEFRDYRKVSNLRIKDAILTSMFSWMENKQYQIKPSLGLEVKAMFAWITRHMNMAFSKEKLPKNMSVKILTSVFVLDKVGTILQNKLEANEQEYFRSTGRLMTLPMTLNYLESVRTLDEKKYQDQEKSEFHSLFRSADSAGN